MIVQKSAGKMVLWVCVAFSIVQSFSSCISTKGTTYFNDLPDSALIKLDHIEPPRPIIQVSDVLDIQLSGDNEKTVQYITQHFVGATAGSLQVIVDVNGNIELPQLGMIKVAGLTREEFKDTITKAYQTFLINPIVNVKFGNFRFTIMGEVRSPGNFSVTNEKESIFEALAQAGDLTEYAVRDKVRILRDVNGERVIKEVNLYDNSILNSPDYYLHRYDLIYVSAKPLKAINQNMQRTTLYLGFITTILAFVTLITK
ncbi:MAG TPA: polysaccharide biosynthesis/export family protein [Panacibacter sp.]|nr:polysaccharide biosynthesis/export family protein [Panacibacter sp.]HNP45197.1 polysaccharide biosynthesis/export family protein [Panacibacter sp.]